MAVTKYTLQVRPQDGSGPRRSSVVVELTDAEGVHVDGFTADGELVKRISTKTLPSGTLDLPLVPNAGITTSPPVTTYYTLSVGDASFLITKTATVQTVAQALAATPAQVGSPFPTFDQTGAEDGDGWVFDEDTNTWVPGAGSGGGGAVASVNGRTGVVTGLAEQSALTTEATTARNADNLTSGTVPAGRLPSITISDWLGAVASQSAMLALSGQRGDWCTRTDTSTTWILIAEDATQLSSWKMLLTPTDSVSSVNGRTGAVTGLAEAADLTAHVTDTADAHDASAISFDPEPSEDALEGAVQVQAAVDALIAGLLNVAESQEALEGVIEDLIPQGGPLLQDLDASGHAIGGDAGRLQFQVPVEIIEGLTGSGLALDDGTGDVGLSIASVRDTLTNDAVQTSFNARGGAGSVLSLVNDKGSPSAALQVGAADSLDLVPGQASYRMDGFSYAGALLLGTGVRAVEAITESAYGALDPPDPLTLYIIGEEA